MSTSEQCGCKGRSHVCMPYNGLQRWDHVRREILVWKHLGNQSFSLIKRVSTKQGSTK